MTDTGQIPGEGLPEDAGMVAQPGIPAPGAYTFLEPSENAAEDDDLLLMPGAQGAWSDPQVVPPAAPQIQQQAEPVREASQAEAVQPMQQPGQVQEAPQPEAVQQMQPVQQAPQMQAAVQEQQEQYAPQTQPVAQVLDMPQAQPMPQASEVPQMQPVPQLSEVPQAQGAATPPQAQQFPQSPQPSEMPQAEQAGPQLSEAPQMQPVAEMSEAQPEPQGSEMPQMQPVAQQADASQVPHAAQMSQVPQGPHDSLSGQPPQGAEPGAHEAGGRDSGSVDLSGVRMPPASAAAAQTPQPARRPLHLGPPMPDASGGVVRSLADRGPAGAGASAGASATPPNPVPVQNAGPVTAGPEYLDIPGDEVAALPGPQLGAIPSQVATPWTPHAQPQAPQAAAQQARAETVVPEAVAPEPQTQAAPEVEPVAEPVAEEVVSVPAEPKPIAIEPVAPEPTEPAEAVAPEPEQPQEAQEPQPVGEFVPVDGSLPNAPHLAPAAEPVDVEVVAEQPAPEAEAEAVPAPVETPAPEAEPVAAEAPEEPTVEQPVAEPLAEVEAVAEPTEPAETEAQAGPEPEAVVTVPAQRDGGAVAELPAQPQPEPEAAEAAAPEAAAPEADTTTDTGAHATATAPAPGYDDAEREAVLRVMRERRDIRNGFRSDPIPHEVLLRVLEAAHTAPSVGHSQPWDFVVIRSAETRRSMHELAARQRDAYAKSLPKGRAKQFKELKIEAILDTPVNIVVTADPTRGGRHTLGRHTQPQMAPYSSALAVENLWLAARAEGLGVGWVSFFDEREMVRALGLPEHLEVVAYLCVGYVDEFPEEPELMQAGWSKRRPLSWVVHEETYGRRALPGEEPHDLLQETVSNIRPLDAKALGEAWERQKRMTKPAGALGMLEIISAQLSGLSRMCPPPIPEPAAVAIFAGDHGVHAQGVTAWPQEVTSQMVANFLGGGAVCNAFANQVGAEVCVVDVGVAGELPTTPGLLPRKVRAGTADFTTGPALTHEEVLAAIEVGIETARDLVAAGNKALLTGEMGIANTTVSAALIAVYTGQDPAEITGRGTGINDEMHARKVDVVRRALDLHQPDPADPVGVLAAVGGLEHAALVGFILGGASLRTPVILDGVSAGAAALVARAIAPEALAACIAGHRSAEPGHVAALNKLGLRPLVDLDLRLGEGTGALLALPVVQSAARAMHEVATFDSAGVTEK
ncbi:nicotinate-nucleotide--dimethylbenzimidazole phosphoribosyltransferase [Streptomyces sp. ISL-98]|uniref:nicotinate-nucleotide--dimethylbenzimidazole phosphoribosyltransferase n=1 Tax=Streptomyces sp. ISL-98 TaxID=2819192 RepID=UPI001BEADA69|nr:nicotinate-nucleotide--dimethylbenzimidazole phosphoribosyltransferase [Streptomyces sp. ISL-98]MBT2506084.1 nicotinate-nucleotide--dimethylbenzimidazole phosphoribosyltransferase [Streptomyces sp. ISL-98]